ncbi:hypothetical protein CYMTET_6241 [Cymbomonas tetramitiformis]|uniref:Enoyl-CoA hydratase n=1 Tax=Cymbomonas tetramitiformis TaxID=36881 RepID=A0AAE0LIP3_9CHLO|nr:hypothetical protein CYMTET_6241 [Cymbomonas tetramitiformis]
MKSGTSRRLQTLHTHLVPDSQGHFPQDPAQPIVNVFSTAATAKGFEKGAVIYDPAFERPASHELSGVGIITLNKGATTQNAMTEATLIGFQTAVEQAKRDSALRVLVLAGSGGFFSAGANLHEGFQRKGADSASDEPTASRTPGERSFSMYAPFLSLLDVEVPTIGALNGHAVGGGFGLALLCDMRVAATNSKYGANFSRLGLHPGMGITHTLPRLVGPPRAAELLYTGRLMTGEEALHVGLVNQATSMDQVLPAALRLAREVASAAPIAVRLTKRTLNSSLSADIRARAWAEAQLQADTVATKDAIEGVAALLEKRKPVFDGN